MIFFEVLLFNSLGNICVLEESSEVLWLHQTRVLEQRSFHI